MLAALALTACGGGDSEEGETGTPAADGPVDLATVEPTAAAVYEHVLIAGGCTVGNCHGSKAGELTLSTKADIGANLVDVPAAGAFCASSGLMRVKPNDPNGSLLLLKLKHQQPCGDPMPLTIMLEADQIGLVERWIDAGAPTD